MWILYEKPSAKPVESGDVETWGYHAPNERFKQMIQDDLIEYFDGSINVFNEQKLTSTIAGNWPNNLKYSQHVRSHLEEFHRLYGPHLADIERQLCHNMRYKDTLKRIQANQRTHFFVKLVPETASIVKHRW
eukprot:753682_1